MYDCNYLKEFERNQPIQEHIYKHVCSNFADRFEDVDGRRCVFHATVVEKNELFRRAVEEKLARNHFVFFGTVFTIPLDLRDRQMTSLADFKHCVFKEETSFEKASFNILAEFNSAIFESRVSFQNAKFTSLKVIEGLPQLQDALITNDFRLVQFRDIANFDFSIFNSAVDFGEAVFFTARDSYDKERLVKSADTSFLKCQFKKEAVFDQCMFGNPLKKLDPSEGISFRGATFESSARFRSASFNSGIGFNDVTFKGTADFRETAAFGSLAFDNSSFESYAKFSGQEGDQYAWKPKALSFKSVDLEDSSRVSFSTLSLNPEAFLNTPIKNIHFINIDWDLKNFAFDWSRVHDFRFWRKEAKDRKNQYQILSVAYRGIAKNSEENDRYVDASKLRYSASEIERIGSRWFGRVTPLSWLYKWSSRFGEVWWWAALVLIGILVTFATYYHFAFFEICPKGGTFPVQCIVRTMTIPEAFHQSLMTGALQTVEYRKTLHPAQDIALLFEKILVPIQAALLVLSIRRKFMR